MGHDSLDHDDILAFEVPYDLALAEMNGANELAARDRISLADALAHFLRPEDGRPVPRGKPKEQTEAELAGGGQLAKVSGVRFRSGGGQLAQTVSTPEQKSKGLRRPRSANAKRTTCPAEDNEQLYKKKMKEQGSN